MILRRLIGFPRQFGTSILGYPIAKHMVNVRYYKPRGDNQEACDNIDIVGFLGQYFQITVRFFCRNSIVVAPLVIKIARVLDLARPRSKGGIEEQLGLFFRATDDAGRAARGAFPCDAAAGAAGLAEASLSAPADGQALQGSIFSAQTE